METSNIIVAFHTGRGGRFYNGGHVSFIGERKIGEFTNDLFTNFEHQHKLYKELKYRKHKNLLDKYDECCDKDDFSFFKDKCGIDVGEMIYTDCNGNPVGLTQAECESGVGCINIDGDYNTTCALLIEDCTEEQIGLIKRYNGYKSPRLKSWIEENYPEAE